MAKLNKSIQRGGDQKGGHLQGAGWQPGQRPQELQSEEAPQTAESQQGSQYSQKGGGAHNYRAGLGAKFSVSIHAGARI